MIRFEWGDLQLTVIPSGVVWMDGGGMFGIVPKPLWEKQREPDESNRIALAMNLLLIEDGKTRTLVDTGAGDKAGDKFRRIHRLESKDATSTLAPVGLTPDQIDQVICTHLHFDHAGGNTERAPDGTLRPAFPNATYVVQQAEIEIARQQDNERVRAGFPTENFEPLAAEDRLRIVEGEVALSDSVRLLPAPGHTPGMQLVVVRTAQGTLAHMADLLPTASHVPYPWIMAFDLEPLTTLKTKKRILPQAVAEGWHLLLEHDTRTPLIKLEEQDGRLRPRPIEMEA